MSRARPDALFHTLTGVFLVLATGALVRGGRAPTASIQPQGLDSLPAPVEAERPDAGVASVIVSANIFSDTRTPPAARYDPFEPDPPESMPGATVLDPASVANETVVPKLYGTVIGPDGPRALMRLDPAVPVAQLYREGDRVGPYRVIRIQEKFVVLETDEGRIVLRLDPSGTPLP
ncbi:MAG: hypothetical protein L0271_08825 [Gemmatimonadetes bacterium]|nr:hypothetical protein [Gemmatimonadota bacterium]